MTLIAMYIPKAPIGEDGSASYLITAGHPPIVKTNRVRVGQIRLVLGRFNRYEMWIRHRAVKVGTVLTASTVSAKSFSVTQ
jgi:hypothetical protein